MTLSSSHTEPRLIWIAAPMILVILTYLLMAVLPDRYSVGLDGATRSAAILFWFLPVMVFVALRGVRALAAAEYHRATKFGITVMWFLPALPLLLMSLFGLLLINDTGFAILF